MKFLPYDKPDFLEPAHDHDPTEVSSLVDLPRPLLDPLPNEIRELLPAVREATSIIFASFKRLDHLLSQRLERLTVLPDAVREQGEGGVHYSEPAYFWYQNQVTSEAQYFVTEAMPDWKHKATKIKYECTRQGIKLDIDTAQSGANAEFAKWFSTLKDEVQEWKRIAEAVEVPDFDQAVSDLMALKARKNTRVVAQSSPEADLTVEEGVRKIEKVDSGIDF